MSKHQDPRNPQYERARKAFEDLSIEDRALFLVQETVGTVVRGIEEAGKALSREIDAAFRDIEHADDGAEPEPTTRKTSTARQSTAKKTGAKKTTTAKKTTAKKSTTAKKRTTKKTPPKDDA